MADSTHFFVHASSYIDDDVIIGEGTKIWHFCHIMSNSKIGKNCILGQNVMIADNVIIGNSVKVQNNVSIYEGVKCEDNVFIGPSAVFTNVLNPRSSVDRKAEFKETIVKTGATIGANATIVCGNNIGKFAFIGAGSLVNRDIKDFELVVGNPARHIGWMSELGERLEFNNNGIAKCKNDGNTYLLINDKVKKN